MDKLHRVVVMSGSMKFFDDFIKKATELSMQGYIVLLPFKDPRGSENIPQDMKDVYDSAHRQRIEMANLMYVVNKGGYIGKSTLEEMKYAQKRGLTIWFMEDHGENKRNEVPRNEVFGINETNMAITRNLGFKGVVTICGSMKFYDIMKKEQIRLSELGYIVYLPPKDLPGDECGNIMNARIAASDGIYVINKSGYIGCTTKANIEFAKVNHKEVHYYDKNSDIIKDKVVTLCGSRRFIKDFNSIYRSMTLMGNTVLTPSIFDFTEEEVSKFTEEEHKRLDENHKRKIDIADIVFIVNPSDDNGCGHVGDNTREEIKYAMEKNKMIVTMCDKDQDGRSILLCN